MTTFLLIVSLMAISIIAAFLLSSSASSNNINFIEFADSIPAVVWEERNGQIVWANKLHSQVQTSHGAENLTLDSFEYSGEITSDQAPIRAELKLKNADETLPFSLSKHRFNGGEYIFAQCAVEVVKAEDERKRFVQSLSQTFAHLPVGVAVFDRDRDLSLFNPALTNLLELSAAWLASRPSLRAFLDQLRENGALPEPKDFKSWRQKITDLEKSASNGVYFEDWNLPNDRVYRATGKPQPKGAVALYIEDISGQVGIEREYRSEIKRLYNGYDSLNMGLAIFYPSGDLSFANTRFEEIWELEISESVLVPNITTLSRTLQEKCVPSPIWGDLRDFVTGVEERSDWNADIETLDGRFLTARFVPLPEGQTLCEFTLVDTPAISLPKSAKKTKRTIS